MASAYGIQHTPTTYLEATVAVNDLPKHGVHFIRLTWVDYANTVRYRVITLTHFSRLLSSPRPSITLAKVSLGLVFITAAPGFSGIGDYLYVPDLTTLRLCQYAPGHASVLGYFEEKTPQIGKDGTESLACGICPRGLLRRVVESAEKDTSTKFLVGFETEFILLKSTNPIQAVNNSGWSVSSATLAGTAEARVLEEIVFALEAASIQVEMYHAEAAPGQFEVVTGPLSPLEAADALVFTRETIYNVASKHGLRATFAPKVYDDNCGSGAHAHISLHNTAVSKPASSGSSLEPHESSFLASLLAHLPAISAVLLPTPASYSRVVDGVWSGGTYVSWGRDNREAPIRLCGSTSRHFEVKIIDGTSNPYAVLASILGVGTRGIAEQAILKMGECGEIPAAEMSAEERAALGMDEVEGRIPKSISEARQRLLKDEVVLDVLGDVGRVWVGINETLETCLQGESEKLCRTGQAIGTDAYMRVMVENF